MAKRCASQSTNNVHTPGIREKEREQVSFSVPLSPLDAGGGRAAASSTIRWWVRVGWKDRQKKKSDGSTAAGAQCQHPSCDWQEVLLRWSTLVAAEEMLLLADAALLALVGLQSVLD